MGYFYHFLDSEDILVIFDGFEVFWKFRGNLVIFIFKGIFNFDHFKGFGGIFVIYIR